MTTTGSRMLFVNLPVRDLDRSKDFFAGLGFDFNPKFTDQNAACMAISDHASVMLLREMTTYVNFGGRCGEAFRFYELHLGGTIGTMMTHGQAPDQGQVRPEQKDAILHASISLGGTELMGADVPSAQPMRSAYLSLNVESDAEAERVFAALRDGGEVFMPMQETFFASRFGQLRDRFGINWMVLHERAATSGE